jgi:hypothetical protein
MDPKAMGLEIEQSVAVAGESKSGCGSAVGKLLVSLFFFVFFAMGSLFLVFLLREYVREMATYRWHATPATVLANGVDKTDDDEEPYRLSLTYRYTFGGRDHTSSRVALDPDGSSSYDKVQRQAYRHPVGSTVTCFVNPRRPEEAVLQRRNPAFGLFAILPLIFVVIGAGGLYFVWRPERPEPATVSISKTATGQRRAYLVPVVLGLVFVAVGGGLFIGIGVVPALRLVRAASWVETPCTIVSSTVRSQSSDDGTTYKVDILFEYQVGGLTLKSNRYDFANFGSSGYTGKREIVNRYPEGSRAVCFVDPSDPTRAVLNRDLRPAYLVGLIPLVFLLAGAAVATWGFRQRRQARDRRTRVSGRRRVPEVIDGPRALEPKQGPGTKILGSLIFTLIWNGILSVFLYTLIADWQRGDHNWFLAIFLVPFVLVGLGSVVMVGYFTLAAFNPRPRITLQPAAPRLGDSIRIDWRFGGRSERIDRLQITLEGREEATYQRGTDTHTDTEVFARFVVADSEVAFEIARGGADVEIPHDTMHSFAGDHNKVVWSLKVNGDVPRWPDVDEKFEVDVRPLAAEDIA